MARQAPLARYDSPDCHDPKRVSRDKGVLCTHIFILFWGGEGMRGVEWSGVSFIQKYRTRASQETAGKLPSCVSRPVDDYPPTHLSLCLSGRLEPARQACTNTVYYFAYLVAHRLL